MKKLLSILLSVIMAMSVIIIPTSVSAKKAKTVPNTYVATYDDILNFSKGTITTDFWGPFAYYKNSGNKYITLDKYDTPYGYEGIFGYYVRGDKVYYCIKKEIFNDYLYQIKTVDLNGKNKKVLYKVKESKISNVLLLGGYGSGAIFYEKTYNKKVNKFCYTVKLFRNNKLATLFKVYSDNLTNINVFNGKIYYQNKAYNLANGKKTTFTAKEIYVTKNYMYYINKNNNLKSLDKKDVRRIVTKNVYKYYNSNNGSSVIYSKLNSKKEEVFYKRTGTDKEYKLCAISDIYKATNTSYTGKKHYWINDALFYNNKVYFNISLDGSYYIVNVKTRGSKPSVFFKTTNKDYYIDMYMFGNKLVYHECDPNSYIIDD